MSQPRTGSAAAAIQRSLSVLSMTGAYTKVAHCCLAQLVGVARSQTLAVYLADIVAIRHGERVAAAHGQGSRFNGLRAPARTALARIDDDGGSIGFWDAFDQVIAHWREREECGCSRNSFCVTARMTCRIFRLDRGGDRHKLPPRTENEGAEIVPHTNSQSRSRARPLKQISSFTVSIQYLIITSSLQSLTTSCLPTRSTCQ